MENERAWDESIWAALAPDVAARVQAWSPASGAEEQGHTEGSRGSDRSGGTAGSAGRSAAPHGLFADLQRDPESLDVTRRLIDTLLGNTDVFTAALELRDISRGELPSTMPTRDRMLLRTGGAVSLGLPWIVRPAARKHLFSRLPDVFLSLKLSGRSTALTEVLRGHSDRGHSVLLSLTGDQVHGVAGAQTEVDRLIALARVPAVKQLAFDPARIVPEANDWSIDADVALAAARLQPLLDAALEHRVKIIIEPQDTCWARQLPNLLMRALARPELDRLSVGASLIAELPESWQLYRALHRFARRRVADGGAPVEVVIGLSDVAARERAFAIHTGLNVSVVEGAAERTALLLRLIDIALQPSRAAVLRPVIATDDHYVAAAVIEAAKHYGSEKLYGLQLRGGVANALAAQLTSAGEAAATGQGSGADAPVPEVRLRIPATSRGEFGGIAQYLVSRIAGALGEPGSDGTRNSNSNSNSNEDARLQAEQFAEAVQLAGAFAASPAPASHRTQQRAREWDPSERDSALFYRAPDEPTTHDTGGLTAAVLGLTRGDTGEIELQPRRPALTIPVVSSTGFANEPITDGCVPENREWARALLQRAGEIVELGDGLDETIALSQADLDPNAAALAAREAAARWADLRHENRAVRLRRVALATAAARDRIITELAAETGAPFRELDAATGHIIDSARYAGQLADGLRVVRGATFTPERLVLVVADTTAPFAVQAAAVLAVLGSGSGALWAVSPDSMRVSTAILEEWEAGGLTEGAVRLVSVAGEDTFAALGASPHVDRAVVLGDRTLGRDLARRRPDLRVEGHFTSRGSILITPSAELGRAVTDTVDSAFRGTQTSLSQARAIVLLGSMARSKDFREQLADAVLSLRVGDSADPQGNDPLSFDVGPLAAPPSPAELAVLRELGDGESWLVQPEQLDDEGLLWSPGVKLGIDPGSPFWDDARRLPVIGLGSAQMLSEAIEQQNAIGSGAIAGIQSWDEAEVLAWLRGVEAASLSVNRPTSDVRIERQPSGGWNEAVMGLPALSGGPHWLLAQGSWERRAGQRSETLHLRGLTPEVVLLIEAVQPEIGYEEFDELRRAALADQITWHTSLGVVDDQVGLGIERNLLRVTPVSVQVRLAEHGSIAELTRVLAAALLVRAPVTISTGVVLPPRLAEVLAGQGVEVSLERDDAWLERLAVTGPAGPGGSTASRVRLIGGDRVRASEWMGGLDRAALWAEPVTMAGPVELLTLLREQSVSARAERHGLADYAAGVDSLLE